MHRIVIPSIVITQATAAGCPLEHACNVLQHESSGGNNWFGELPPAGCGQPRYSPVTADSYREYRTRLAVCGSQGVGPCQLTWEPYQDTADSLGGCWEPSINCLVGFTALGQLLRRHGPPRAYSMWNTGSTDPSSYADRAMGSLPHWQRIVNPPSPPREGDHQL